MFTKEQQDQAIQAARFQQEVARGIEAIFSAFPTLMRCEANTRMLQELCRDFMGEDVAPDLDTFRNLLDLNQDVMKSLVQRPVEVTRQQLIADILALLASKNGGRDGKYDQFNLRSEKTRMSSWSLDALRARLHEIRTKQQMSTQPVAALKSFVADSRTDTRPYPGYPTLPPVLWDGSKDATVDAEYLNGLARADIYAFKRLCHLYGSQQVDHRRGLK